MSYLEARYQDSILNGDVNIDKNHPEVQEFLSDYKKFMENKMDKDTDMINHPPHYNRSDAKCECGRRIECIDVTRHLSFNIGNVIKYLWRADHKDGVIALKKARWYLDDAITQLEGKPEAQYVPQEVASCPCTHGIHPWNVCTTCDSQELKYQCSEKI